MPRGTCSVCGCTQARACFGGCYWTDHAHEFCSQCVGWALLKMPNPYMGILPYDLLPVRTLEPIQTPSRLGAVYPIDLRRIESEALTRLGYILAGQLGFTIEEFIEEIGTADAPLPVRMSQVEAVVAAFTIEKAADMARELRACGTVRAATAVRPTVERSRHRG